MDKRQRDAITNKNLTYLRRKDASVRRIVCSASHVAVYRMSLEGDGAGKWQRPNIEGPLFIVEANSPTSETPTHKVVVVNRKSPHDFSEEVVEGQMDFDTAGQTLFFIRRGGAANGLWFFLPEDMGEIERVMRAIAGGTYSSAEAQTNLPTPVPDTPNPDARRDCGPNQTATTTKRKGQGANSKGQKNVPKRSGQGKDNTTRQSKQTQYEKAEQEPAKQATATSDDSSEPAHAHETIAGDAESVMSLERFFPNLGLTNGILGTAPPHGVARTVDEIDAKHAGQQPAEPNQEAASPEAPSPSAAQAGDQQTIENGTLGNEEEACPLRDPPKSGRKESINDVDGPDSAKNTAGPAGIVVPARQVGQIAVPPVLPFVPMPPFPMPVPQLAVQGPVGVGPGSLQVAQPFYHLQSTLASLGAQRAHISAQLQEVKSNLQAAGEATSDQLRELRARLEHVDRHADSVQQQIQHQVAQQHVAQHQAAQQQLAQQHLARQRLAREQMSHSHAVNASQGPGEDRPDSATVSEEGSAGGIPQRGDTASSGRPRANGDMGPKSVSTRSAGHASVEIGHEELGLIASAIPTDHIPDGSAQKSHFRAALQRLLTDRRLFERAFEVYAHSVAEKSGTEQ